MQQAWAQVKSKEPLNKRGSLLPSSGSNVQDHMQRQPANRATEQKQQRPQSGNRPNMQNSGRDSGDQQAPGSHAVQPSSSDGAASREQVGYGQMSGSFNGGQTGAGQLAAALSSAALLQNTSGMQMPFPGQGEPSSSQVILSALNTKSASPDCCWNGDSFGPHKQSVVLAGPRSTAIQMEGGRGFPEYWQALSLTSLQLDSTRHQISSQICTNILHKVCMCFACDCDSSSMVCCIQ